MISAVSANISVYKQLGGHLAVAGGHPVADRHAAPGEAGGAPVDAAVANGMTQGMARGIAREEALSGERPEALTPAYIGPAREAARAEALSLHRGAGLDMNRFYQDLMTGCQAGPKPASAVAAESRYLEARGLTT